MAGCKAIRVAGDRADRGAHVAPGHLQLADPAQAFVEKVDFADDGNHDAQRLCPHVPATTRTPRWLLDENSLGVALALQHVRGDITWPGAPDGLIPAGATDTTWLPLG